MALAAFQFDHVRVWLAANPWAWHLALAVLAALIVARVIFGIFFDDSDDFLEALRYSFQPDWLSWMRGEWLEDSKQSFKLFVYFLLCGGAGAAVFTWLEKAPVQH